MYHTNYDITYQARLHYTNNKWGQDVPEYQMVITKVGSHNWRRENHEMVALKGNIQLLSLVTSGFPCSDNLSRDGATSRMSA